MQMGGVFMEWCLLATLVFLRDWGLDFVAESLRKQLLECGEASSSSQVLLEHLQPITPLQSQASLQER